MQVEKLLTQFITIKQVTNGKDLSGLGAIRGIQACKLIDFIHPEEEVVAVGYENGKIGFCGAFNPCSHTYAIAQRGVLEAKIFEIIKLSIDALGVSVDGKLEVKTKGKMWNGVDVPAELPFSGHFALKGSGKIVTDLSSKIKMETGITTSVLLNVDPNGNGVVNPFTVVSLTDLF